MRTLIPDTHMGSFFGNAIADWTGLFVTVVATKYFFEIGSAESRRPPNHWLDTRTPFPARPLAHHLSRGYGRRHGSGSLRVSKPTSKWGQVVGNIVSEWTQIFGMVLLTKHLLEYHSKESRK